MNQTVTEMETATAESGEWIEPQPGPQEQAFCCDADILIYGGQKGGGKTWFLLNDPVRYCVDSMDPVTGRILSAVPDFGAVFFRRTFPEIKGEGGMWEESLKYYPIHGAKSSGLIWRFPSGARISFSHIEHEKDLTKLMGWQIAAVMIDQVETLTKRMFFYLVSLNRSTCGIRPYLRATCNPEPDSWLRDFLKWWIDEKTGFPIKERAGKKRWYAMVGDDVVWNDRMEPLLKYFNPNSEERPLSVTFIPAALSDNQILMKKDPTYLSKLKGLPLVERERLLYGNWNIRATAGTIYKRDWFRVVDAAPKWDDCIRYWDRGSPFGDTGGSSTAGAKVCRVGPVGNARFYVLDMRAFRETPGGVRQTIRNVAEQDGRDVRVGIEQDPAYAGKAEADDQIRNLQGFNAHKNPVRESKGKRSMPLSAQVEAGNVFFVRGDWNEPTFRELENFDGTPNTPSDRADALSGAFFMLTQLRWARIS